MGPRRRYDIQHPHPEISPKENDPQVSGFQPVPPSNYITSGESQFEVGVAEFRNDPQSDTNPYYSLSARKFTIAPSGGFDGWDIYREYRTNGDRYTLGNTFYLKGAATSVNYSNATGWGAFKQIVGPDKQRWANTDY